MNSGSQDRPMRVSVLFLGDSLDQVCGSGTGALLMCTRYAISPSTKRIAGPTDLAPTKGHTFRVVDRYKSPKRRLYNPLPYRSSPP
jgi:hypothetical protein